MQRLLKLKKLLRGSSLTVFAEAKKNTRTSDSRFRQLSEGEIETLEDNGNKCDDWARIRVEAGFTASCVRRSTFVGQVRLPAFYGTVLLPGDVSFPTGIYDSLLCNCEIENALIYRVSMLANVYVGRGAVVQNVGTLISSGKLRFPDSVCVGSECGGRNLRIFPEATSELLEMQLSKNSAEVVAEYVKILDAWEAENQIPCGVVGSGAVLSNVQVVRNSWIGSHARVEGALKVRNSVILSSLEEPTGVFDGVILENSLVQEAVKLYSAANIAGSLILKKAKVGKKAMVASSVISQCVHIEEGEVTNSFVGPLAQMHHHSLLIAAVWPAGCGNLGYGANVGSNHTGRMPDQEIRPALGMFFGLGVNVKFPANFSEAPFSILATGVTTAPQRLRMPFSLIVPGSGKLGQPAGLNEILPGWVYSKNAAALERNLYKYSARAKGLVQPTSFALYSIQNVRLVSSALSQLLEVKLKDVYTGEDLCGLGANYMRETSRQLAILAYRKFLERFLLDFVVDAVEADNSLISLSPREILKPLPNDIIKDKFILAEFVQTVPEAIKRARQLSREWYEAVLDGFKRDRDRGREIFDDYDEVHEDDKEFLDFVRARLEGRVRSLNALLKLKDD